MQALFAPAVALMNRLGYSRKFAVMGALALAAIALLLFGLYNSLDKVIRSSQQELAGIEAVKPLARLVQQVQQHRGMSAALLNGNAAMAEKRAAKELDVAAAFKVLEPKLLPVLSGGDAWKKSSPTGKISIRTGWVGRRPKVWQHMVAWSRIC